MTLSDGYYIIHSKASNFIVGRRLAEDRSLRPKGIYTFESDRGFPNRFYVSLCALRCSRNTNPGHMAVEYKARRWGQISAQDQRRPRR